MANIDSDDVSLPMTVRDLYDGRFETIGAPEWREHLLHRRAVRWSVIDAAYAVLALDVGPLPGMVAFPEEKVTTCLVPEATGVWRRVGTARILVDRAVSAVVERINTLVIRRVTEMVRRLRAQPRRGGEGDLRDAKDLRDAEDHLKRLVTLFQRLRTPAFASSVVKLILAEVVDRTGDIGIHPQAFDAPMSVCMAFADGVYNFRDERRVVGAEALTFCQTLTVGYRFAAMAVALGGVDDLHLPPREIVEATAVWQEYDRFLGQTFDTTPGARGRLIDLLASSALNEPRKVLVVHHDVHGVAGACGKTTLFALVAKAFGDLFVKCASSMAATGAAAVVPAEARGKRVLLFSEQSADAGVSAAFVRALTDLEEQTAPGAYEPFVFAGTAHVFRREMPAILGDGGNVGTRVIGIPYGSTFADRRSNRPHHFLADKNAHDRFDDWKHCLLWEVMQRATLRFKTSNP
jgi:hypothetical protein